MTVRLRQAVAVLAALWMSSASVALEITSVTFASRHPWRGLVDIDVDVEGVTGEIMLTVLAKDEASGKVLPVRTIWKEGDASKSSALTVSTSGIVRFVWDVAHDVTNLVSSAVSIEVQAAADSGRYMVVDLSAGFGAASYPVTYLKDVPQSGWTDEYKTDKLVLRSANADGMAADHYVGIFPVTQRQYALVTDMEPSWSIGDKRPVEFVSYGDVRGNGEEIFDDGFIGLLRKATGLKTFDLPTEEQWERDCRAGTTSDFNNGGDLDTVDDFANSALDGLGCYAANCGQDEYGYDCTAEVGSYAANNWGIYDMHGNVMEWCRDIITNESAGIQFVLRGGSYVNWAADCTSDARNTDYDLWGCDDTTGFRVVCEKAAADGGASKLAKGRIDVRSVPYFAAAEDKSIRCDPKWFGAASCRFDCDGKEVDTLSVASNPTWPTSSVADGRHDLTLTGGDATLSAVCYKVPAGVTVVQEGTIKATTTWGDGTYVVSFPVTVVSNETLTISSGTVVKFADGASLTVEPGSTCVAEGVIFTHVNDDTVGKEIVTEEGALPQNGRYALAGKFVDDETTEYRYLGVRKITEDIAKDTVLRAGSAYEIDGAIGVMPGVTLTVNPGCVVKFAQGASLTVYGTLAADAKLTQPVVFTSLRDDEHGGDTNGDGALTTAASGDWRGIVVASGGTVRLRHCKMLYGSDKTDVGVLHMTGGTATLDSCEIAHAKFECVRVNGGSLTAQNSVFRDAATAFGYYGGTGVSVVNCVIADCTIASRGPDKHFKNTVFYRCVSFFLQQGSTDCSYCQFFNPAGYGDQMTSAVSEDAHCRWGDPLFKDPANADYTPLSSESPCVDAAYGPDAPDVDALGNARTNVLAKAYGVKNAEGKYPDIGVIEYYGANGGMAADLAVLSVSAPPKATVGANMTVTYVVTNRGSKAEGTWRDGVAFVSSDGAAVVSAGTVCAVTEDGIPAGGVANLTASVTVPVLREGVWRVRVTANAGRELRENETSDNVGEAKSDTAVGMTASALDKSVTRTVVYGYPVGLKYAADAKSRVLNVVAPPGAVIRYGLGFVPSDTSSSGAVTVGADGTAQISLPAGSVVYVVISSDIAGTVIVTPAEASLTVTGVNPNSILRRDSGEALLTVDGLLFDTDATVVLSNVETSVCVPARGVSYLSAERLVADFDPAAIPYTGEWRLAVVSGGRSSGFGQSVLVVDKTQDLPELICTTELPSSIRQGCAFDLTVNYHLAPQSGAQVSLQAPIVTVRSPHLLFQTDYATYTNEVRLVALGSPGSEGELVPGVNYSLQIKAIARTDIEIGSVWHSFSVLTASTAGADGTLPSGEFLSTAKLATATGDERARLSALEARLGRTWAEFFDRFSQFVTFQGTYGLANVDYAVMIHDYARHALDELRESDLVPVARIARVKEPKASEGETGLSPVNWIETDCTNRPAVRVRTATNLGQLDANAVPGAVWVYDDGAWYRLWPSDTLSGHYRSDGACTNCVVLCHGALESLHASWLNETAAALKEVGVWPTGEPLNVLAVDWGLGANADASAEEWTAMMQRAADGGNALKWMGNLTADRRNRMAEAEYGFAPALRVAAAAKTAYDQLAKAGIAAPCVTLVGAGHGGHVAGAIAGAYASHGAKVRRLVGLETSAACAFAFVDAKDRYPVAWSRDSAEITEFYKSTCWLSAGAHVGEGVEQVFGHFNFTVIPGADRVGKRAFFEGRALLSDNGSASAGGGAAGYLLNADSGSCEGRTNRFLSQAVARWFAETVRTCGYDSEYGGWCGLGWSWMEDASPPKFALPFEPYDHDIRTYTNGFHAVIRERERAIDLVCPEEIP